MTQVTLVLYHNVLDTRLILMSVEFIAEDYQDMQKLQALHKDLTLCIRVIVMTTILCRLLMMH